MDKVKEILSTLKTKFLGFSKGVKIALIIAAVAILVGIFSIVSYTKANKYGVLFSDLDANDAKVVTNKLTDEKVDMVVDGSTILVPKEQVDQLRLELAPELTNGSVGYELMDDSSSLGMTDEEFKLKKLRMLQGELERTIKSFPQIDDARVHITLAKDSVFVEDKIAGKAAVYLKIKPGETLETEQVRSIVALVSGSTENIPKENIEVVDDKMNLLTSDLFDEEGNVISSNSVEKQRTLERNYEKELEKSISGLLEPVLGKGKVSAKVNVDLDFDSKNKTQTIVDPNKVIISQQTINEYNNSGTENTSNSNVDNNMSNVIPEENQNTVGSSREEQKTNYEVGKTETQVISAPGEVRRLTASVMIDGEMNLDTQEAIKNIVSNAIGYNGERGDEITVLGMEFDLAAKEELEAEFKAMEEAAKKEKIINIVKWVVIAVLILVLVFGIIYMIKARKEKQEQEKLEEEERLNVLVGEEEELKTPVDFSTNNPQLHVENEIKQYAKEKPEQVVDIVKSWLTDDEGGL